MSTVAFIYPGQGSQKIGMGEDIRTRRPDLFANYLDRCSDVVGLPVAHYCLAGPGASLNQTSVAQPALFAHSLALTAYARELGIQADFIAGHSLGEYTAATAAGVLSFEDGLHLVMMRGKLSLAVQSEHPGAMLAVTGLTAEVLSDLCASISSKRCARVGKPKFLYATRRIGHTGGNPKGICEADCIARKDHGHALSGWRCLSLTAHAADAGSTPRGHGDINMA